MLRKNKVSRAFYCLKIGFMTVFFGNWLHKSKGFLYGVIINFSGKDLVG
jgi:hypothetical protein